MNTKKITLTPPIITESYIDKRIICIRGHRERIFQNSYQILDNKIIFHNYGQGGAGWTFLFGCVNNSIRQFEEYIQTKSSLKNKLISVIGAGCYGLLTAISLARKGYNVRIIAKEINNITSYNAAGFFFPRHRKMSTSEEIAIFKSIGMESFSIYKQIINNQHDFITQGVSLLPCYFSPEINPGFENYISQKLIDIPQKVIINFNNDKKYEAIEYKTLFINAEIMMQELHNNLKKINIPIYIKEINNFLEVEEEIIFNCTGLGAKQLTNDKRIIPIQGHLITLKNQPYVTQLQYMINSKVPMLNTKGYIKDELLYFAPKNSGILGITFIRGEESITSNLHEFDRLLQRCKEYFG